VEGCDEHYFGGLDEPDVVKQPPPEKSAGEKPKDGGDGK